ncbi:MAG: Hpt domain-containing protein, partial [Burkholderiales bacterium]|nr:Hpt domain-containing protein [Burkholderiales bacterium]
LRNVGGELGVLRRVLDRFVQIYADGLGPLDRKLAHSLRGASAAIGAGPLQAALQAYEAAAGEADAATTQELATAVAQELGQLVSRLREALGPAAP